MLYPPPQAYFSPLNMMAEFIPPAVSPSCPSVRPSASPSTRPPGSQSARPSSCPSVPPG